MPEESGDTIGKLIQDLGAQLSSAQRQLLSTSSEMITELERKEVVLPRVLRQKIGPGGETTIERIGATRIPLSNLVRPGVFQIRQVRVHLPVRVDLVSDGDPLSGARVSGGKEAQATLELTYEYEPLVDLPTPSVIEVAPILDLRIEKFERDRRDLRRCTAAGVIEAKDGDSGKALAGEKIFLAVESGNVLPSVAKLDERGLVRFRIDGQCSREGRFDTELVAIVLGSERSFKIGLSAKDD